MGARGMVSGLFQLIARRLLELELFSMNGAGAYEVSHRLLTSAFKATLTVKVPILIIQTRRQIKLAASYLSNF